jgi:hypothetical protein
MSKRTKYEWTPSEWAEYYEHLARKNEMSYQESGEPRYERAQFQYDQIADAFRALAWKNSEQEVDMKKRMGNCDGVIGRLIPNKDYSYAEVCKMLKEAVWW